MSRVPVCDACLAQVEPLDAEYLCAACRAPFASSFALDAQGLCSLCRRGLNGFDAAYSFAFYDGVIRDLIQLFKYGGVSTLARPLGILMTRALPRDQRFDVILPMPMHWWRRWQRGFNQAELLAREISRRSGIPFHNWVRRARATSPQAGLTGAQRRANVGKAFHVPQTSPLTGRRVLLVDDVLTTGASASACARAIKRAGAEAVTVLTVARADRRMWTDTGFQKNTAALLFQETGSLVDGESGSLA